MAVRVTFLASLVDHCVSPFTTYTRICFEIVGEAAYRFTLRICLSSGIWNNPALRITTAVAFWIRISDSGSTLTDSAFSSWKLVARVATQAMSSGSVIGLALRIDHSADLFQFGVEIALIALETAIYWRIAIDLTFGILADLDWTSLIVTIQHVAGVAIDA